MIFEPDAVVAPDEGGAARASTGGDAGPAFAGFGTLASFGGEPVERGRGGGEGAGGGGGGGQEGLEGGAEAWGRVSEDGFLVKRE